MLPATNPAFLTYLVEYIRCIQGPTTYARLNKGINLSKLRYIHTDRSTRLLVGVVYPKGPLGDLVKFNVLALGRCALTLLRLVMNYAYT